MTETNEEQKFSGEISPPTVLQEIAGSLPAIAKLIEDPQDRGMVERAAHELDLIGLERGERPDHDTLYDLQAALKDQAAIGELLIMCIEKQAAIPKWDSTLCMDYLDRCNKMAAQAAHDRVNDLLEG